MSDLLYSDTEEALRDSVRRLFAERCPPESVMRAYGPAPDDFSAIWHALAADLGMAGLLVPEELGGAGASAREAAVVMEEIGRAVAPVPFLTSSVLATVAYAAPEVLSNAPIDGRVDIYSLGCALFRLLTGMTPFPATNGAAAVMTAHLFSPPPRVTDRVPSLPAALDQVIAVAMAKDPAARFGSASALADAAAGALHDRTFRGPLPPIPGREVGPYPVQSPAAPPCATSTKRT